MREAMRQRVRSARRSQLDEWIVDVESSGARAASERASRSHARCNSRARATARTSAGFSAALLQGLAPDGGLYVPEEWPRSPASSFGSASDAAGDGRRVCWRRSPRAIALAPQLPRDHADAFNFPAPLWCRLATTGRLSRARAVPWPDRRVQGFRRALPRGLLGAPAQRGAARPLTILVATSGDTGGAVAAAFHRRPGIEVAVLFPKGLVSPTQEHQLTCWGDNVHVVRGARHASMTASGS